MVSVSKPILGVKPAWLALEERNAELARALQELSESNLKTTENYRTMATWAVEIYMNCNTILELDKISKK